jgi:hypothetical protein
MVYGVKMYHGLLKKLKNGKWFNKKLKTTPVGSCKPAPKKTPKIESARKNKYCELFSLFRNVNDANARSGITKLKTMNGTL